MQCTLTDFNHVQAVDFGRALAKDKWSPFAGILQKLKEAWEKTKEYFGKLLAEARAAIFDWLTKWSPDSIRVAIGLYLIDMIFLFSPA